tara:strand:- start:435 stop:596 length:162 start_codon:yes stop_codon:yes gene_type:complete
MSHLWAYLWIELWTTLQLTGSAGQPLDFSGTSGTVGAWVPIWQFRDDSGEILA